MTLDSLPVRVSALVEPGAITGRVRVLGPKGGRSKGRLPPRNAPRKNARTGRAAGDTTPTKQISASLTAAELAELNAACERAQMSRSSYVAQALRHFHVKIFGVEWHVEKTGGAL